MLINFNKKNIKLLPKIRKENLLAIAEDMVTGITAEVQVPGAKIRLISARRLIVAFDTSNSKTPLIVISIYDMHMIDKVVYPGN